MKCYRDFFTAHLGNPSSSQHKTKVSSSVSSANPSTKASSCLGAPKIGEIGFVGGIHNWTFLEPTKATIPLMGWITIHANANQYSSFDFVGFTCRRSHSHHTYGASQFTIQQKKKIGFCKVMEWRRHTRAHSLFENSMLTKFNMCHHRQREWLRPGLGFQLIPYAGGKVFLEFHARKVKPDNIKKFFCWNASLNYFARGGWQFFVANFEALQICVWIKSDVCYTCASEKFISNNKIFLRV